MSNLHFHRTDAEDRNTTVNNRNILEKGLETEAKYYYSKKANCVPMFVISSLQCKISSVSTVPETQSEFHLHHIHHYIEFHLTICLVELKKIISYQICIFYFRITRSCPPSKEFNLHSHQWNRYKFCEHAQVWYFICAITSRAGTGFCEQTEAGYNKMYQFVAKIILVEICVFRFLIFQNAQKQM